MLVRNKNLLNTAKALRKNMTDHEKTLWYQYLRHYPVKFYKQKIIGNYIVDFYCDAAKLVIELDGSQHYQLDNIEYDKVRTEFFNSIGIKVIRFLNIECDDNFNAICKAIDNEVNSRVNNKI